jgi:AraC-like DNA-binding protein
MPPNAFCRRAALPPPVRVRNPAVRGSIGYHPDVLAHVDVDQVKLPAFALADDHLPGESPWHTHRKHQLLYAASGTLALEVEGSQWILPPQRAAWIAALAPHRVRIISHVALRTVYLSPRLTRGPLGACCVFAATPLAREMILFATRWGPDEQQHAGSARDAFFAALAALCEEWSAEALPFRLPTARTPELARAMQYAIDALGESPSIEEAARRAALSTRTLARRFADEAQTTWRLFLHHARMLRAMELLASPGARVTDTALAVGFESFGAFTRAFEEFTGERPKDYRKRITSQEPQSDSR